ncbi:MAG: MFS transporter, partial [Chloroflexi bacterium]|nr:MFS transporter [Chloroflexota bacterium]
MIKAFPRSRSRIFYGWWIVATAAFFNFVVSGTYTSGFTAFFTPLRTEFGWTSVETALGFSLQRLEGGIAGPLVGFLFDRLGPRKLVIGGMAVAGGGLMLMSRIDSLVGFYATFLMTAVGISFGFGGPPIYCVSNWFVRKRTKALSYLMAGINLGGIVVPFLVLLIAQAGWRTSLFVVGLAFWAVAIPVALILRHRPEAVGFLPDGVLEVTPPIQSTNGPVGEDNFGAREALKSAAFWLIALAFMLSQLITSAVIVLEMPLLESAGISREVAGIAVTFTMLMTLSGNLLAGFIGDRFPKTAVMAFAFALQCVGVVTLALVSETWHIAPFVILYGLGLGATMPMRNSLVADYFGR